MSSKTSENGSMIPLLTDLRSRKARDVVDGIFQGKDLTPQDFFDGISNVLKNDKVTKEMTDSLFAAFDLNSSESLSKKELAGGLSLACMGNLEDRITFAFEQYGGDDNMLNIQELTQYFTSVFSVLKRLHPDAPEFQVEGSVKKLASSTASTCMKTFDIDEDNKLSIDEFRAYFFPQAQAAKEAKAVEAAVASLSNIRPEKLLSDLPSEDGLDLEGFVSWIGKFTSKAKCDDASYALMFKAIDVDDSGKLDRDEIMAAVSMFCRGGSPKERVRAVFQYFDKDNNSELSEEELVGYFTSVFRCMQSFDGSSFEGRTAMSLARITVTRALLDADKDKSGSLSFNEFTKIFLNEQEEVDQKLGVFQVVNALKKSGDASKLMQALQDVNGDIDRVTFRKLIRDQIGDEVNESCIDMLYAICDRDGDGVLGLRELGGGLTMMCQGTPQWRAEQALKFYSSEEKGLTRDDLEDYFASFLSVMAHTHNESIEVDKMAVQMAHELFSACDDGDGVITLEEFTKFYLPGQFSEVVSAMKQVQASDVLNAFKDVKDSVDSKAFCSILGPLIPNVSATSIEEAFRVFDTDGNKTLDKNELGGGLTLLCDGDPEARVRVAFQFFDDNDGKLSREELRCYFRSVFRVLSKAGLTGDQIDRPDSIAHFTVSDGLERYGKKEGGLTADEFLKVFLSDDNDDDEELKPTSVFTDAAKAIKKADKFEIPDKKLTRSEFESLLQSSCNVSPEGAQEIFDALDLEGNDELEPHMYVSAFLLLTEGDPKWKAEKGFKVYAAASSSGDDNTIEESEMEMYLRPIFRLARRMNPGDAAFADGDSADDVAADTAKNCFDTIDKDNSGTIDFDEFVAYFLEDTPSDRNHLMVVAQDAIKDVSIEALSDSLQDVKEMDEKTFTEFAKARLFIDDAEVAGHLFQSIDADQSGTLSPREIIGALSFMCYGEVNTKISTIFEFFDEDGSRGMSRSEMRMYLLSMFNMMYRLNPNDEAFANGATPSSLASSTVADAFDSYDADSSGQIELNEFVEFMNVHGDGSGNDATPQITAAMSQAVKSFESLDASDFVKKIREATKKGELDRNEFVNFVKGEVDESVSYPAIFELFDALDRDGNASLTQSELGGLILLCGGDATAKARAAFGLYDKDDSSALSPDELLEYLTATFKLMIRTRPDVTAQHGNVDPDHIARSCVKEIFSVFDKDKNNRIDLDEFVSYYLDQNEVATESKTVENDETANFLVSATDEVKIRVFDGSKILSEFTLDRSSKSREIYEKAGIDKGTKLTCLGSGKRVVKMLPVSFLGGCCTGVVDVAVM